MLSAVLCHCHALLCTGALLCSTLLCCGSCCTLLFCALSNAVLYSVLCCVASFCAIICGNFVHSFSSLHCPLLYSAQCSALLCSLSVLPSAALHFSTLHYIALLCTVLYLCCVVVQHCPSFKTPLFPGLGLTSCKAPFSCRWY